MAFEFVFTNNLRTNLMLVIMQQTVWSKWILVHHMESYNTVNNVTFCRFCHFNIT